MIYSSVSSAVVSALAAEAIDNTSKQVWQKLYRSGYEDGRDMATLCQSVEQGSISRMEADCWIHARLHSQLIPRQWNVLVAKYSTHRAKKGQAINSLPALISSNAPHLFLVYAVTAWAIPKLKGVEGKRSTDVIVLPAECYDINRWDPHARPERTRNRWKKGINDALNVMVDDALCAAGSILEAEGLSLQSVA